MKYATAREAYDLLKKVPADKFIQGISGNGIDKCCAAGHVNRLLSKNPNDYSRKNCDAFFLENPAYKLAMAGLVNANDSGYTSEESKANSLKFLDARIEPKKSLWKQIIDSFK